MDKIVEINADGESINKTQFEEICHFFKSDEIVFQYDRDTNKIILIPAENDE